METTTLLMAFAAATQSYHLPKGLLSALCYVESNHSIQAVNYNDGGADSLGICQLKYNTARLIGYKGTAKELLIPSTNIHWAGKYLFKQMNRYNGDINKAVAAYNAGTHLVNDKGLTKNRKYVAKVFRAWGEGR